MCVLRGYVLWVRLTLSETATHENEKIEGWREERGRAVCPEIPRGKRRRGAGTRERNQLVVIFPVVREEDQRYIYI